MTDELVEHVDDDGNVVAVVTRAEMRRRGLRHRCVYLAVCTSAGEIVVHRRADWKDVWPSRWDLAFGGVVAAGESWGDAARRELAEETGIVGVEPVLIGSGTYSDREVAVLGRVFRIVWDGDVTFTDGEVAESARVPIGAVDRWMVGRELCPDTVALVRPLLT